MKFKVTRTDVVETDYVVDALNAREAERKVRELPLIQREEIHVLDTRATSRYQTNPFKEE